MLLRLKKEHMAFVIGCPKGFGLSKRNALTHVRNSNVLYIGLFKPYTPADRIEVIDTRLGHFWGSVRQPEALVDVAFFQATSIRAFHNIRDH
jgi:hypothetical protein